MKLIFVYNANSGFLDRVLDNAHKIVSPDTYECNLCALTFGKFTEDDLWKAFRENSALAMEFYHKDEFERKFRSKWLAAYTYPTVLIQTGYELSIFMNTEILNTLDSSEALIEEIHRLVT
ncbi:MAG: GTPase [Bacteroidetes bacterium]|nr:GTPase [Bacteroidota bacterium]